MQLICAVLYLAAISKYLLVVEELGRAGALVPGTPDSSMATSSLAALWKGTICCWASLRLRFWPARVHGALSAQSHR